MFLIGSLAFIEEIVACVIIDDPTLQILCCIHVILVFPILHFVFTGLWQLSHNLLNWNSLFVLFFLLGHVLFKLFMLAEFLVMFRLHFTVCPLVGLCENSGIMLFFTSIFYSLAGSLLHIMTDVFNIIWSFGLTCVAVMSVECVVVIVIIY